jgi:hypothetical protein
VYPKDGLIINGLAALLRYEVERILSFKHWYTQITLKSLVKNKNFKTIDILCHKQHFDKSKHFVKIVFEGLKNVL